MTTNSGNDIGFGKPPQSSRFKKGKSGNPRGRPGGRREVLPYDHVLGQMVTVREEGRERRITAAEAFLLHLTKRGLEGDSVAARSSLAAIETARNGRPDLHLPNISRIVLVGFGSGGVGRAAEALRMVKKIDRFKDSARLELEHWVVKVALDRLREPLTPEQQTVVWETTHKPGDLQWPEWWTFFG